MTASDRISRYLSPRTSLLVGTSVVATLTTLAIVRLAFSNIRPKITPSPRVTQLPKLSKDEQKDLPYPPDVFPGGRDVTSCYGTIRVYEWGPETGRKVLLIHGISTPCLALGGMASGLADRGCRVMVFDLWGRGYSDSVDLPHDSRLYSTQILLALASSSLAWTPGGFSLIGYSLGGGIAVDFAVAHPAMVQSLVLLAPGGLIRSKHFAWSSRLMYLWMPDKILQRIVRGRLQNVSVQKKEPETQDDEIAVSEAVNGERDADFEIVSLSKTRPGVTVASAVDWQIQHHQGFVRSFISSIQNSSIEGREETWATWRKLALRKDKTLVFAGSTDGIIVPEELEIDATETIGAGKLDWRIIQGGHEFPITCADEVVNHISQVWGL